MIVGTLTTALGSAWRLLQDTAKTLGLGTIYFPAAVARLFLLKQYSPSRLP
jgi:hypothetical protein